MDYIIGRVMRVNGIVSKPELNGTLVNVESFDETAQRYVVRAISSNRTFKEPFSVRRNSLELVLEIPFCTRFPTATANTVLLSDGQKLTV